MHPRSAHLLRWLLVVIVVITAGATGWLWKRTPAAGGGVEPDPQTLAQIHYAIEHYLTSGQLPEARRILARHLEIHPADPLAHYYTAKLLVAEARPLDSAASADADKLAEALRHLEKSFELGEARHESRFEAALLAQELGDNGAAARHYLRAMEMAPEAARYPLFLAALRMKEKNPDEAEALIRRALHLDPALPDGWGMLAEIASARGRIPESLEHVNAALEFSTEPAKRVGYTLLKARLLRESGREEAALAVLRDLPEEEQRTPRVTEHLAACCRALGRSGDAAEAWEACFAQNPADAGSAAEAGLARLEAGQMAPARRWLGMARRVQASHPKVAELEALIQKSAR